MHYPCYNCGEVLQLSYGVVACSRCRAVNTCIPCYCGKYLVGPHGASALECSSCGRILQKQDSAPAGAPPPPPQQQQQQQPPYPPPPQQQQQQQPNNNPVWRGPVRPAPGAVMQPPPPPPQFQYLAPPPPPAGMVVNNSNNNNNNPIFRPQLPLQQQQQQQPSPHHPPQMFSPGGGYNNSASPNGMASPTFSASPLSTPTGESCNRDQRYNIELASIRRLLLREMSQGALPKTISFSNFMTWLRNHMDIDDRRIQSYWVDLDTNQRGMLTAADIKHAVMAGNVGGGGSTPGGNANGKKEDEDEWVVLKDATNRIDLSGGQQQQQRPHHAAAAAAKMPPSAAAPPPPTNPLFQNSPSPSNQSNGSSSNVPILAPKIQDGMVGIGAQYEWSEDGLARIWKIVPGGSAARSNQLKVGDLILAVDGFDISGTSLDELLQRIVGPPGSLVRLVIFRDNKQTLEVTLSRDSGGMTPGVFASNSSSVVVPLQGAPAAAPAAASAPAGTSSVNQYLATYVPPPNPAPGVRPAATGASPLPGGASPSNANFGPGARVGIAQYDPDYLMAIALSEQEEKLRREQEEKDLEFAKKVAEEEERQARTGTAANNGALPPSNANPPRGGAASPLPAPASTTTFVSSGGSAVNIGGAGFPSPRFLGDSTAMGGQANPLGERRPSESSSGPSSSRPHVPDRPAPGRPPFNGTPTGGMSPWDNSDQVNSPHMVTRGDSGMSATGAGLESGLIPNMQPQQSSLFTPMTPAMTPGGGAASNDHRVVYASLVADAQDKPQYRKCDVRTDATVEDLCDYLHRKFRVSGNDVSVECFDPDLGDFVLFESLDQIGNQSAPKLKLIPRVVRQPVNASTSNTRTYKEIDYKDLIFGREIAVGAFKSVSLGEWRGSKVAISKIKKTQAPSEREVQDFRRELELLAQLLHPNIVLLLGAVTDPRAEAMCIVTEYMSRGSLHDVLYTVKERLELQNKMRIVECMCNGLNFLHQSKVCHRDIKSLNILVDDSCTAKLTDFGVSRQQDTRMQMAKTLVGTCYWMAPDVMSGKQYDPFAADVYSMALVIYEVAAAKIPYEQCANQFALLMHISHRNRPILPSDNFVTPEMAKLIKWMWHSVPSSRPIMSQVCKELDALKHDPTHVVPAIEDEPPASENLVMHPGNNPSPPGGPLSFGGADGWQAFAAPTGNEDPLMSVAGPGAGRAFHSGDDGRAFGSFGALSSGAGFGGGYEPQQQQQQQQPQDANFFSAAPMQQQQQPGGLYSANGADGNLMSAGPRYY